MGMTDLQFKSHLRGLLGRLEEIEEEKTLEEVIEKIEKLKNEIREDLQS